MKKIAFYIIGFAFLCGNTAQAIPFFNSGKEEIQKNIISTNHMLGIGTGAFALAANNIKKYNYTLGNYIDMYNYNNKIMQTSFERYKNVLVPYPEYNLGLFNEKYNPNIASRIFGITGKNTGTAAGTIIYASAFNKNPIQTQKIKRTGSYILSFTCLSNIPSCLSQLKHITQQYKSIALARLKMNVFGALGFGALSMYHANQAGELLQQQNKK